MSYRNRIYSNYAKWKFEQVGAQSAAKKFVSHLVPSLIFPELRYFRGLQPQSEILELGCGAGEFLTELCLVGFKKCTGVDFLPARTTTPFQFVQSDIFQYLRQSDKSFEVICLFDVLEHFSKDEVFEILDLVFARLNPGGIILVRVPNQSSSTGRFNQFADFSHECIFNETSLAQVLKSANYAHVSVRGVEVWIKILLDPRRWIGGILSIPYWIVNRMFSLAWGGPRITTSNILARAQRTK